MISAGPIPTLTLRAYLQEHVYPATVKITSVMVMNMKARVRMLHRKHGGVSPTIPMEEMRNVFHKHSLENAPQDWNTDPIYAKVFKQCMTEVLSTDECGGPFPILKVMEKVKELQTAGYDFDVFRSLSGQPVGLLQMVPAQKEYHLRWGDIAAGDSQDKTKNTYGWFGPFPAGWNGDNQLMNFCDAMTLEVDSRWFAWVYSTMSRMSGRPLESVKIIPCDLGLSPENIKSHAPGEGLPVLFFSENKITLIILTLFVFAHRS